MSEDFGENIKRHKRKRINVNVSSDNSSTDQSGSCTETSLKTTPDPQMPQQKLTEPDPISTSSTILDPTVTNNNSTAPDPTSNTLLGPILTDTNTAVPDPMVTFNMSSDLVIEASTVVESQRCSSPVLFNETCEGNERKEEGGGGEESCEHLLDGLHASDLYFSFNISTISSNNNNQKIDDKMREVSFYPFGTFYGLPETVRECFIKYRGIEKLYDWQDKCLNLPNVKNGTSNLIYSLPTSGGKTLVAEILILQQLLLKRKDVLFILPYVSIVQEKVRELLPFSETLNFAVEEYAASKGRLPPVKKRSKHSIYIATIEKANALVNSLIELKRLSSIGLVVVDELHMLGEERGAVLESTLAKLLYISVTTRIIGMSATLNNIHELATFMKAQLFTDNFRPVHLEEYIKMGDSIFTYKIHENGNAQLVLHKTLSKPTSNSDLDQLSTLVQEVLPLSCLVFCATKKSCENVAVMLSKTLPESIKLYQKEPRNKLIKLLRIEAAGLCPILSQTLPYGVAYHHSGLTSDERRLIEEAYLAGTLNIITCTSTLAAGVNLPARRVIIRQPYIGNTFITKSRYKQMIGRAGRSGLSEIGESIIIIQPKDKSKLMSILSSPCESCNSFLLSNDCQPLSSLLLSLVALQIVQTEHELESFIQCTLLYHQQQCKDYTSSLVQICVDILSSLSSSQLVTVTMTTNERGKEEMRYVITDMGRATHKGCLNVTSVHTIYNELYNAQRNLVLTTDLHLLILTVPHQLVNSITPNWRIYFEKVSRLSPEETHVATLMNINIGLLTRKLTGSSNKMSVTDKTRYTSFYISLILYSLIKATNSDSIWRIADSFNVSRGFIQSLLQQTCSYASCLIHFTEELPQLWSLKLLLPSIVQKLSYSASSDLIPLLEIQGMKQGRARQLVQLGIKTPQDLLKYTPSELSQKIEHLYISQAGKLLKSAKLLLTEKAELLQDEAHELTELLPPNL